MRDGHVHSHYCPHGTKDSFEEYVEIALKNGYDEISFTEHFPLPDGFEDPSPKKDSAPTDEEFESYLKEAKYIQQKYKDKIKINVGTEVDYIEGFEYEIKKKLEKYGDKLNDAILSVHMIKADYGYSCVDYSEEEFKKLLDSFWGIDKLYRKYYETVKMAIESDLGVYKPKRFGHLNLIRKYCKIFEYDYSEQEILLEIIELLKEKDFELDFNVSGLRKEFCGEVYISGYLKELVEKYEIKTVLGSDSHIAKTILTKEKYLELMKEK